MCQHGSLWTASTSACELKVRDVIGANYTIEDVKYVIGDAIGLLYELVVLDEVAVVPSNQADCLQVW